jgi:hypothetical protein
VSALPTVTTLATSQLSLEVIAIAGAVFALVQCLLWCGVPAGVLWMGVVALMGLRRSHHDVVFARPTRSCSTKSNKSLRMTHVAQPLRAV